MIALGGTIGTGLFYGSRTTISLAGPAVLISYALAGFIIYLILRAMGEMSVDKPVAGAFSQFAYDNWGPYAGFLSGWNYWFTYIFVSMAELAAVGVYVKYWLPGCPEWLSALICLLGITAINLINVKLYGEFEFWFAIIKVGTIILFIVLGIVIIFFGVGNHNADMGVSNLWKYNGFFATGAAPFFVSIVAVLFSFGGTELVGITAGEAENPKKSIPLAINRVIARILMFYIISIAVMLMMFPWDQIGAEGGFDGSPFVQVFRYLNIPAAAGIINFVVLSAAVSVYNSCLYSNSRMLHALSLQGNAPKVFQKTGKAGTPVHSIILSSGITVIVVIISIVAPGQAFGYMMSTATIAIIINWAMILITHLMFRRKRSAEEINQLSFKMPLTPYSNYFCLVCLVCMVLIMLFSQKILPGFGNDFVIPVIIAPIWIIILTIFYFTTKSARAKKND